MIGHFVYMNEKGLIAYYNIFLVFLICISLTINYFNLIIKEKNMLLYKYDLVQVIYMDQYIKEVMIQLNELDQVPSQIVIGNYVSSITKVDENNSIYSFYTWKKIEIPSQSSYANCTVTFKFIKGSCKILKTEMKY